MTDIRTLPIEPDKFYHIYNRGVNGNVIFKTESNYHFFLKKISENLLTVCDIYAYTLLPNHFHLLVKIKSEERLKSLVKVPNLDKADLVEIKGLHSPQNIFSKQFSKVFNSYSQAFNKMYNRHGALIESPFKRKCIDSEDYLIKTILYIHQNPQNHEIINDFKNYTFSSYQSILGDNETFLKRNEVIELFSGKDNFVFCHENKSDLEDFE
ncbi:transposase [Elizabethkingia anophelis]|nr:transposase [Elizabethkingia anophelis]